MSNFSKNKVKTIGVLACGFLLFIIGVGIYNFITHPFNNKSIITHAKTDLNDNKQDYEYLLKYMDTIQSKYKIFNFGYFPKTGIEFSIPDTNGESKSKEFKLQTNFNCPNEIKQIFIRLGIDNFYSNLWEKTSYYIVYKSILNHSMTGKKITLYYFNPSYPKGFFNNHGREEFYFQNSSDERNKNWLYKIDSNWIIKSKKTTQ